MRYFTSAILLIIFIGCKDSIRSKSSEKSILSFKFYNLNPPEISCNIDQSTKTITGTVPFGTDLKKLVPIITTSPNAKVIPVSGSSQDFSNPVLYTVIAEDNTQLTYTVTIIVNKSSEKEILEFNFEDFDPIVKCEIDKNSKIISANISTISVSNLIPKIKISERAKIEPSTSQPQDFTKDVIYTVTAEDGSKQNFTVKINLNRTPTVFFSAEEGKIYALDAENGKKRWEFTTDKVITADLVIDNGILFAFSRGKLYALDVNNGKLKAEIIIADYHYQNTNVLIKDGVLIYPHPNDIKILGLNTSTLKHDWQIRTTGVAYTLSGNDLIILNNQNVLVNIDIKTQSRKFSIQLPGTSFGESLLLLNNEVFVKSNQYKIFSFDVLSGKMLKEINTNEKVNVASELVTDGDNIFFSTFDYKFHSFDLKTQKYNWTSPFKDPIPGRAMLNKNLAFIQTYTDKVYAIDKNTGELIWFRNIGFVTAYSSPVLVNETLYVGNTKMMALNANDGKTIWEFPVYKVSSPCVIDKNGKVYYPRVVN